MEHAISRLLTRRAPLLKPRALPKPPTTQQRALMSDGRPFFSQTSSWSKPSGLGIIRRTYHYFPPPDTYSGYLSGRRVVWTLIGLNAAVFGAWQYAETNKDLELTAQLMKHATLSKRNLEEGRYYTFVTSAFSHKDPVHFICNMMAFDVFGRVVSRAGIGGFRVLILAIGSAVTGSLAWHYHQAQSRANLKKGNLRGSTNVWRYLGAGDGNRVREIAVALGASGMVMGLGAAATLLSPMEPMMFGLPLFLVTGVYVAFDTYSLDSKTSRIGHAAHLGGLAFGVFYYVVKLKSFGGVWHILRRGLRR